MSWGSGAIATAHALATGERDIAVIGCGALGLTTALQLQRAGGVHRHLRFDESTNQRRDEPDDRPAFANLDRELIDDLIPQSTDFRPGTHSLGRRLLRRNSQLMFNLTAYTRTLVADFTANGGKIEIAELHAPAEFARVKEKTLINTTGYGARAIETDLNFPKKQVSGSLSTSGLRAKHHTSGR